MSAGAGCVIVADGATAGGEVITWVMLRAASVTNFCKAMSEAELKDRDDEFRF